MTLINYLGAIIVISGAWLVACGNALGLVAIGAGAIVAGTDWERI